MAPALQALSVDSSLGITGKRQTKHKINNNDRYSYVCHPLQINTQHKYISMSPLDKLSTPRIFHDNVFLLFPMMVFVFFHGVSSGFPKLHGGGNQGKHDQDFP